MQLPMPVERGIHALPERRRVEDEVVGRAVEAPADLADHVAERRGGPADLARRDPAEVRLVAARHDPDLERRAGRPGRERDARAVFPHEPLAQAALVADEPAPRALALADHVPCRATQLLTD